MRFKKTNEIIPAVFIILFYLAALISILHADNTDKISIEELASVEMDEALGIRLINIKDDIYILVMFRDYLQMFKYSDKTLQPGEKYSFSDQPPSPYKTRCPSACIIIKQKQENGSILIACNTIRAGLHHTLKTVSPFISIGIGQPVAAGKLNGINFLMTDRYMEGTDIFKGELKIFRSEDSQLLSAHSIKPYYKIITLVIETDEIENWLILNATNELVLYDKDFAHFISTGLKTGDFALSYSEKNKAILVMTSDRAISKDINDSLRFYRIDHSESKPEIEFIGETDLSFLIKYVDLLDHSGDNFIAIVKEDEDGKKILSILKVEF